LDPGSWMGKKSGSGSGIRDEQPGSYFLELRNHFSGLKYLNSLMRIWDGNRVRIRDPGWKKSDPGSGINIPDPQHWNKGYNSFPYNFVNMCMKLWSSFQESVPACLVSREETAASAWLLQVWFFHSFMTSIGRAINADRNCSYRTGLHQVMLSNTGEICSLCMTLHLEFCNTVQGKSTASASLVRE